MKDLKDMNKDELLALIDNHDCHRSPYDGCDCEEVYEELYDKQRLHKN